MNEEQTVKNVTIKPITKIGVTRKDKSLSKKRRRMEKNSRRRNRK